MIFIIVGMLFLTSCSGNNSSKNSDYQRYDAQFLELFDTASTVIGFTKTKEEFSQISEKIYNEFEIYHQLFDIYNDYDGVNNLKTINDNAGKNPVKVDKKIIEMLKFAKEMTEQTNGEFNVAFGAVLKIWHDYRSFGVDNPSDAKLPTKEELENAREHTDFNKMIVDEESSTVYLEDSEMSLDVGGVAKGYAVEKVAQMLEGEGVDSVLMNIGGNVRIIGKRKIDDSNWRVGLDNPQNKSEILTTLSLSDTSVVTSGDYQRYFTVGEKNYHHIIDKDTLFPSEYFRMVTLVYKDSGMSDALTTFLFNVPLDEGIEFVENLDGAEALWVMFDGTVRYSSGMESLVAE